MVTINCTPKNMKYGIYPVKYGIIATLELALNIHTSQLFSCDRTRDWDQTPVFGVSESSSKISGRFSSLHARVTLRFGSIWKAPGCSASHTTGFFSVLRQASRLQGASIFSGILMLRYSIFMILHGIFVEEFFVGVSVNNEFCKFFIYLVDLA